MADTNSTSAEIALRIVRLQKRRSELVSQKMRVQDSVKTQEDLDKDRAAVGKYTRDLVACMPEGHGWTTEKGIQICDKMEVLFDMFTKMMEKKKQLKHEQPSEFLKDVENEISDIDKKLKLAYEELEVADGSLI